MMTVSAAVHSTLLPADAARALLRRHRISPTEQRVQIARVMLAHHQHLSAEQLLTRLLRNSLRVSKATVYNTLKLFSEKGLVREVVVDHTKLFYDSNLNPHHHLFYTDTGELEDVEPVHVRLSDLPELPEGTNLQSVDVVLRVSRRPGETPT